MPFDAGTIRGSLDLDTTSFNHGFQEAHTHAESEGGRIREVLESLTEVFNEALGPAVAQFGNSLRSVFAGFSEGPVIGIMGAIATAAGAVREAVEGAGERFHKMGLEAEKAGVSAEFMSRLTGVAGTVKIGVEQVGLSFKLLEQRVQEASEGNKQAEDGFRRLGISVQQAGELTKDPQKLYETVMESMGRLTSATERQRAAGELMGRQGSNLIPLFAMTREEFNKTADTVEKLSGGVTASDVRMGESFGKLEAYVSAAFEGIEKAVSKPILAFIESHVEQFATKLEATVGAIANCISAAWDVLSGIIDSVSPVFEAVSECVEPVVEVVSKLLHVFGQAAGVGVMSMLLKGLMIAAAGAAYAMSGILVPVAAFIGESVVMGAAVDAVTAPFGGLGAVVKGIAQIFRDLVTVALAAAEAVIIRVTAALTELANGPFRPGIEWLDAVFHRIGQSIQWVVDKVSNLIAELHELAGTPNLFGTSVNAPGTATASAPTPESTEKVGPEPQRAEPAMTDPYTPPPRHDHPARGGKEHHTAGGKANPGDKHHHAGAMHQANSGSTGGDDADDGQPATHKPQTHAKAVKGGFNAIRTELGDAVPDAEGNYHVNSVSGGGMGGILTPEMYHRLREKEKEHLTGGSAAGNTYNGPEVQSRVAKSDSAGPDSIALWHRYHKEEPDSIQKMRLSAMWRGPTKNNHPDSDQMDDAIAAGAHRSLPGMDSALAATSQSSDQIDSMLLKPAAPSAVAAASSQPQIALPAPAISPAVTESSAPAASSTGSTAPASKALNDTAVAIDKLLSPIQQMEKSFASATVSADALKSGFDALHNNVNALVSRMTDASRQPQPARGVSAAGGAVTNNFTVNTQYDPRDSVNQFAAKVLPAIRDLKRRQDDQLAGAMAASFLEMSMAGGDQ